MLPASIDGAGLTGLVSASSAANIWAWAVGTAPFEVKEMLAESPTNVWATRTDFGSGRDSPIVLLHWNGH